MRRFTAEPSHHPIAWLVLPAGLLIVVSAFTSAQDSLSLMFLTLGLGLTADGLAEVLPVRQRGAAAVLRIASLIALCVAFVTALVRLVFIP